MRAIGVFVSYAALTACQASPNNGMPGIGPQRTALVQNSLSNCDEMPSNSAKGNCQASDEALTAEAAIEPVYQALLNSMDAADRAWEARSAYVRTDEPTFREALIQSQALWTQYRDAQCQIEMYEWRGGASAEQRSAMCALRMNRDRLAQLKKMQREF